MREPLRICIEDLSNRSTLHAVSISEYQRSESPRTARVFKGVPNNANVESIRQRSGDQIQHGPSSINVINWLKSQKRQVE